MANRRMLSMDIVDTDAFLDMPVSAQLLYFHLSIRADDDGFVSSPKKIMRIIGSQSDDYKVLMTKKFIIPFEDGVCVIKHWRINNFIRKDIYKETKYLNLKQTLFIRKNGAYTLTPEGAIKLPEGHFQLEKLEDFQAVNVALTERQPSKGKVRLGKVSKDKVNQSSAFNKFWEVYPKKKEKQLALAEWKKLKPDVELQKKIIISVEAHKKTEQWKEDNGRYIIYPARFLKRRKWEDEIEIKNKSKYDSIQQQTINS